MRYSDTIRYLHSLGNEVLTAKLGLQNIAVLLEYLGNPHRSYRSVLIAGTNGKGSVAAYSESIFRASGLRTGLYTSPHLVDLRERISVNGEQISEDDFSRITQRLSEAVALLLRPDGYRGLKLERHPTFFEMVTALAFLYFEEEGVSVSVTEVGMGGRYDATNLLDPTVAVITNVDLDHQKYLGETIAQIASEKVGIIKSRSYEKSQLVVASGSNKTPTAELIDETCRRVGATLLPAWRSLNISASPDSKGRYSLELGSGVKAHLPLAGEHQVQNAILAIQTTRAYPWREPLRDETVKLGLESTHWPGRLEIREQSPTIILDGAHNPAGARCVKEYCEKFLSDKRLIMIFAAMRDKAIAEIGRILFPLAATIVLTLTKSERCARPEEVAQLVPDYNDRYFFTASVEDAVVLAMQTATSGDIILGLGSLFLVGEIRYFLEDRGI